MESASERISMAELVVSTRPLLVSAAVVSLAPAGAAVSTSNAAAVPAPAMADSLVIGRSPEPSGRSLDPMPPQGKRG